MPACFDWRVIHNFGIISASLIKKFCDLLRLTCVFFANYLGVAYFFIHIREIWHITSLRIIDVIYLAIIWEIQGFFYFLVNVREILRPYSICVLFALRVIPLCIIDNIYYYYLTIIYKILGISVLFVLVFTYKAVHTAMPQDTHQTLCVRTNLREHCVLQTITY